LRLACLKHQEQQQWRYKFCMFVTSALEDMLPR
jgi:hypothetical protein